jgi:D-3-phosphoglycerate dehydrogenase
MFSYMKPNALLINTARADLIDQDAMIEAIKEKNIRVAVDVIKNEPEQKTGEIKSPLQDIPNVYVTHHIGASTEQAQNAVAEETVRIIKDFVNSGLIAHWVNRTKVSEAHYQLVIKHYDKPGVLSRILDVIRDNDINIEEIENVIFEGGVVACCTMKLRTQLSTEMIKAMNKNPDILSVSHIAI